GGDRGEGEAAVDRPARDQRGPAARRGDGNPARLTTRRRLPVRIVLGVGAGIAAYKVCELLRLLTESGHAVRVVPTPDSLRFVGAATWKALSGQPVSSSPWDDIGAVPHVTLGQQAD